ncbi:MAG: ATP-binding protein, partial [Dehalococcoidia bacterium]|nr:ATP-binding protein [Dehalococcoidia bacterium]
AIIDQAVGNLTRSVMSETSVEPGLERFVRDLVDLFDVDRASIGTYSENPNSVTNEAGYDRQNARLNPVITGYRIPTPLIELLLNPTPGLLGRDEMQDLAKIYEPMGTRLEQGFVAMAAVGLEWQGRTIGSVTIWSRDERSLTQDSLDLLGHVAAQVAGSIGYIGLNQQLESDLLDQLAISEMAEAISAADSVEDGFENFTRLFRERFGVERASVAVFEPDTRTVTDIYQFSQSEGHARINGLSATFPQGLLADLSEQTSTLLGRELLEKHAAAFPPYATRVAQSTNVACTTFLWWQGAAVGALLLYANDETALGKDELLLLDRIATHVSGAIGYLLVNRELESDFHRTVALAEIGQIVGSALDIDSVFARAVPVLRRLVEFDDLRITTADIESGTLAVLCDLDFDYDSGGFRPLRTLPLGGTHTALVLASDTPVRITVEPDGEHREGIPVVSVQSSPGTRSAVGVPLVSDGITFGAVLLSSLKDSAFDEVSDEILLQAAAQLSGAIAYHQVNERLSTELREQSTLARIGQILGASSDIGEIFDEVAGALTTMVEFDTVFVNMVDEAAGEIVDRHISGIPIAGVQPDEATPIAGTLTEEAIRSTRIVRISANDEGQQSAETAWLTPGFKSGVAVPLIARGEVVGSLQFRSISIDSFPNSLDRFLTLVAEQLSGAIARAQLAENQTILAVERERTKGLASQNQELVQIQRMREQFLGMVTHELRTPLTSISAFTDILSHNRDGTLTERQLQQLDAVSRNTAQLSELMDDLIHVSRIERGEFNLMLSPTDLVEIVTEVCESLTPVIQHRGQKLVASLEPATLLLDLDRSRMIQVLNNLVSNASKFSPQGSNITVDMQLLVKDVQIEVADEGPGIDPAESEVVFDPFYRADNEHIRAVPGTGLGLYVARTIVRQHGGDITVVPAKSKGTRLRIVLPLERSTSDGD